MTIAKALTKTRRVKAKEEDFSTDNQRKERRGRKEKKERKERRARREREKDPRLASL